MNRFIEIPSNPAPPGAEPFHFEAADGAKLRGAFFPVKDACATVVLMTGWAEFIEKYFEVIGDIHGRKMNVAMMDWRGQGLSSGASAQAMGWRNYFHTSRDDLRLFTDQHAGQRFEGRFFLMTHSMGGLPALMLLAQGFERFERAILCAPMTRLFGGAAYPLSKFAARALSAIGLSRAPASRPSKEAFAFEGNMYTTDRARHERFRDLQLAEPAAAARAPAFGWVNDAIKAGEEIHQPGYFDKLKIAVLIISAGLERRIEARDHKIIASFHEKIQQTEIPGALHEIMMERDEIRDQYWKAVDDFLAPAITH